MIYSELEAIFNELKPKIIGKPLTSFFCTAERIFIMRFEKRSLTLSFQEPYLAFFESKTVFPFSPSPFAHEIEKSLKGKLLTRFEKGEGGDRKIYFYFENRCLTGEFYPKRPNLILEGQISLNPVKEGLPPQRTCFEPSNITSRDLEIRFNTLRESKLKAAYAKKIEREIEKKKKRLQEACKWKQKMEEARLLQTYLFTYKKETHTLYPPDHLPVPLPQKFTPARYLDKLFRQVKKEKEAIPLIEKTLSELQQRALNFELPKKENKKRSLPYKEFFSPSGYEIWVGKKASANDLITFKLAKGLDLWLHAHHEKGAHVIIRTQKNKIVDDKTINFAMKLAIANSTAKKRGEGEVLIAEVKHLKKPSKSSPGQVQVSKPKVLYCDRSS